MGRIQVVAIEAIYIIIAMVEINSELALDLYLVPASIALSTMGRTATLLNQ